MPMDRRRAERRAPSPGEPLSRVRLRTGDELVVVNLSPAGLLVEGCRLLPGAHVDVHVVTRDGRVLARSRIVRSYVCDVKAHAISFQSALAFDRPVDTAPAGYLLPTAADVTTAPMGSRYPVERSPSMSPDSQALPA